MFLFLKVEVFIFYKILVDKIYVDLLKVNLDFYVDKFILWEYFMYRENLI